MSGLHLDGVTAGARDSTQRGVRGLMPRQGLQELPEAGHRERQDQPVRLGQGEGTLGGLARKTTTTR